MKRLGFAVLALIVLSIFTMSGCSSAQKKLSEDVRGINTKVDTLETRVEGVETKQSEVERLAMEQAERLEGLKSERAARSSSGKTNVGTKDKRSRKDKDRINEIQTCLKNAGFYKGEVDGIKGRKTISAIKKFQGANGLTADGVVGKKTREALSKYASGGGTTTAGGVEEEASAK
ncbi:MAG: peptidoglycan-binding domain-containing protein [Candidatus Omnitrophica bacterium]|nr:peptidoglycan-binding domain-containing protein [Candidatus Omnitrophota bacterium]